MPKYILIFLLIALITLVIWSEFFSDWTELSLSERKSIQEHKIDVGADYIYCMKVRASDESYKSIVKMRQLNVDGAMGKKFSVKCNEVGWWDIPGYVRPEYASRSVDDSLELIVRVDGVIYFTSEVW